MGKYDRADYYKMTQESIADDAVKDRAKFDYASDILATLGHCRHALIGQPNRIVREVIGKTIRYGSLLKDDLNEFQKQEACDKQAEFIRINEGREMLCEALGGLACRLIKCPLFVAPKSSGVGQPICKEWKIMFRRG